MKIFTFFALFLFSLPSFAEEDIRSNVAAEKHYKAATSEIDIGKHIFGHEYGISENDFIAKEGKPDGYLSLSGGKTVMIYGKTVGIVFRHKKLVGVRISSHILDWTLSEDLKSTSRFDGINWKVKQGVYSGMSKEQLEKTHGAALGNHHYEQHLQIGEDKLIVKFSSSKNDKGATKFFVCGIYLLRE